MSNTPPRTAKPKVKKNPEKQTKTRETKKAKEQMRSALHLRKNV